MTDILQVFKIILHAWNVLQFDSNFTEFSYQQSIDNKSLLSKVMACHLFYPMTKEN